MEKISLRARYRKLRPLLFWVLLLGTFAVIGASIYKELTSPLPSTSEVTGIVSASPPQTEPPTAELKANYSVPPHNPKHLLIPKLNVTTNIYPVGITKEKAIDAPDTAWGVGWYQEGTLPGSGSGAALIDGHVNDAFNTPGVFYEISKLTGGDNITIIRGDDSELRYEVVSVSEEPLRDINMNKVLSSIEASKEGLNLITCGGKYDRTTNTYSDRIVVFAVRVG